MNDRGEVIGISDSKRLLEDIPNKIRTTMGIMADVNLLSEDGKEYIEIAVSPSSYPVNYKGEYYYFSATIKPPKLIITYTTSLTIIYKYIKISL